MIEPLDLPIIGVEFVELEPDTYAGCSLSLGDAEFVIDTGDPTMDYMTIWLLIIAVCEKSQIDHTMHSSSLDHFIMDGGFMVDIYNDPYYKPIWHQRLEDLRVLLFGNE